MDGPARTLVVLPTYQEAANIAVVLGRLHEAVPHADILVVDDASPDGTADLARRAGADLGRVDVLERAGKHGLGGAYRAGFQRGLDAGYDVIAQMDSDLSHDPAALPDLLAAIDDGADAAIGSRYVPGGRIPNWSAHRRWLSQVGNRYAVAALRLPLRDATSGYRAFRATTLAKLDVGSSRADGYGFQIEMAHRLARVGAAVTEVPIVFTDRLNGRSKMSKRIVVEALVLVTTLAVRDRRASH